MIYKCFTKDRYKSPYVPGVVLRRWNMKTDLWFQSAIDAKGYSHKFKTTNYSNIKITAILFELVRRH